MTGTETNLRSLVSAWEEVREEVTRDPNWMREATPEMLAGFLVSKHQVDHPGHALTHAILDADHRSKSLEEAERPGVWREALRILCDLPEAA